MDKWEELKHDPLANTEDYENYEDWRKAALAQLEAIRRTLAPDSHSERRRKIGAYGQ